MSDPDLTPLLVRLDAIEDRMETIEANQELISEAIKELSGQVAKLVQQNIDEKIGG